MRPKNKAKENCSQSAAAATRATLSQRQAEPQAEAGAGAQSHLEEVQAKAQSQSQSTLAQTMRLANESCTGWGSSTGEWGGGCAARVPPHLTDRLQK